MTKTGPTLGAWPCCVFAWSGTARHKLGPFPEGESGDSIAELYYPSGSDNLW